MNPGTHYQVTRGWAMYALMEPMRAAYIAGYTWQWPNPRSKFEGVEAQAYDRGLQDRVWADRRAAGIKHNTDHDFVVVTNDQMKLAKPDALALLTKIDEEGRAIEDAKRRAQHEARRRAPITIDEIGGAR